MFSYRGDLVVNAYNKDAETNFQTKYFKKVSDILADLIIEEEFRNKRFRCVN